jgi:hypothetical protein
VLAELAARGLMRSRQLDDKSKTSRAAVIETAPRGS